MSSTGPWRRRRLCSRTSPSPMTAPGSAYCCTSPATTWQWTQRHSKTIPWSQRCINHRPAEGPDALRTSLANYLQPDGPSAVSLSLPETTDCAQLGAVCTTDGRKLHNHIHATLPGPAGHTTLASLSLDDATLVPALNPDDTHYTAQADAAASQVTVEAIASSADASVDITPADADTTTGTPDRTHCGHPNLRHRDRNLRRQQQLLDRHRHIPPPKL